MLNPDQIAARRGKITSSIAAACLGLSEHMSPLQAKMCILGESDFAGNKATERGNRLEDIVLDYPAELMGLAWERAPFRLHHEYDWAADSCDALYYETPHVAGLDEPVAIGEGKTVAFGGAGKFGEEGTDEVPLTAWVQSNWHLAHWPEVNLCYVPVLVGGYQFEFRLYKIYRDYDVISKLLHTLGDWYQRYIVDDQAPAVRSDDDELIAKLHPTHQQPARHIESGSGLDHVVREYFRFREARELAEKEEDRLKAQLKLEIGDHEGLTGQGWGITYRNRKESAKTEWRRIAEEWLRILPDTDREAVLARHTAIVPGPRVFLPKLRETK